MVRLFAVLLCLAVCIPAADTRKRKKDNIEIVQANAHRIENTINMDGEIRNKGEKAISGLVLQFDFMDSDHVLLTQKKAAMDEESLEPGKEASFHVQMDDVVRAVEFQVNAVDEAGRDLRVEKPGPFAIE